MYQLIRLLSLFALVGISAFAPAAEHNIDYLSLCYHDVRDDVIGNLDSDAGAVSTRHLAEHFEWLSSNGYQPISIDDIIKARRGIKPLPNKAVLLSFDDGYASFYSHIYPLLKLYNYPAIFALVTDWLNVPAGGLVTYGKKLKPRNQFLSWEQVIEMQRSGLIEVASHSHNLHRGIIANPQGNTQAAAVTRIYFHNRYETDEEYQQRIRDDFKASADIIEKQTGQRPRTMVWPYGRYSNEIWKLAKQEGYQHSLILTDGKNRLHGGDHIRRHLIDKNPSLAEFKALLEPSAIKPALRSAHIDLDYIYDTNPKVTEANIGKLVERIFRMGINTVFLQAFADPDGDGNADSLYFPNRHLPMRYDLFNRVAWQLETRANVDVYAWMPVLAFDLGDEIYRKLGVQQWHQQASIPAINNYKRLSPFNPEAKKIISEIYTDLGKHAAFNGVLFHDDAYLNDYEDVSPAALRYYKQQGLTFDSPAELRKPDTLDQWASVKENALNSFTIELANILRHYQPELKTARNIYAMPIINPTSQQWFAQSLKGFANSYDYTAIMAMPYMEQAKKPNLWLQELQTKVKQSGIAAQKIIFELQAVDWRNSRAIKTETLVAQMQNIVRGGHLNLAYYPDDVHSNNPRLEVIRQGMSLDDFPYRKK